MISTRKIFNQVNHVNLRYLRAIELSATDSVRTRKMKVIDSESETDGFINFFHTYSQQASDQRS